MHRYILLDFGNGERLEQWGAYRLRRPDPTASGVPRHSAPWHTVDAAFIGEKGKGEWKRYSDVPDQWFVRFGALDFTIRLAPYKHTGLFPEQEQNWLWMREVSRTAGRSLMVLNLFAYTGGATIALAKEGHHVTHVDASKPAIQWAKQNAVRNGIPDNRIRWILDDAPTFVRRECTRGKKYDAILLDPPAYGHGPSGKTWRVERDLAPLLEDCAALLSNNPVFFVLNGYATGDTPQSLHRLLTGVLKRARPKQRCNSTASELLLLAEDGRALSTGVVARCCF